MASVMGSACLFFPIAVMDDMGMNPDDEGEELLIDPEKEAYYASDPKQALRKFFEREGAWAKNDWSGNLFCALCLGHAFTFLSVSTL